MRAMLAYAPRPGPLGRARPWIAAVYLAPLAVIAFTFANPLVLVAAGGAAAAIGVASGAGREHRPAAALVARPRGDGHRRQRDRLPARRDDPDPRLRLPGRRPDRHHPRGAGRGRGAGPADPRRPARLRGLVGVRRPRPGAAGDPPDRLPLGADGDPRQPARPARCGRRRPDGRGRPASRPRGRAGRTGRADEAARRRLARPLRRHRRDARAARLRARDPLAAAPAPARARRGGLLAAGLAGLGLDRRGRDRVGRLLRRLSADRDGPRSRRRCSSPSPFR